MYSIRDIKEIILKNECVLLGDKLKFDNVKGITNSNKDSISWISSKKKNYVELISNSKSRVIIVPNDIELDQFKDKTFILCKHPRYVFTQILLKCFQQNREEHIVNYVDYHLENDSINIGSNVFIGKNVKIGENTIIYPNVVIENNTEIGKNCIIKPHVSIGTEAVGYETNPDTKELINFPQLGNVVIEDNVQIGPNTTVRRAALDSTRIKKGCIIGSLINIGHNCEIGENCILTSQVVIAGSSKIGDNVFMGINSSVKNGINIDDDSTVGQGAVVIKNVNKSETVIGNPAMEIGLLKKQ